jgi:hypothetical protein
VSNRSKATCLFDDLVGAGEQGRRNIDAERLRGLQVDDKLEPGGKFDRQVAGFAPFRILTT